MRPAARPVWARLQRSLLFWFGVSILVTGATFTAVGWVFSGHAGPFRRELEGVRSFVGQRFAHVWADAAARDALAAELAEDFRAAVTLHDADGRALGHFGGACDAPPVELDVVGPAGRLGNVVACVERPRPHATRRLFIALAVSATLLWLVSGRVARRLARPFEEVTRVAREIGAGKLSARMELPRGQHDEAGEIAAAVNDMAARIERQIADQRELLAAVSHELRTPLGHVRMLAELLRDGARDASLVDQLDREVVEIDALVGDLLASSRLDFAALSPTTASPVDLAARALERAGLAPTLLSYDGVTPAPVLRADPTLVGRALSNLLENAARHAGGATRLGVVARAGAVVFEVDDAGQGFAPGEEARVFQPFYVPGGAPRDARSLGLGLSLVKRIAEAHGGRAWAENLAAGGARVSVELPS